MSYNDLHRRYDTELEKLNKADAEIKINKEQRDSLMRQRSVHESRLQALRQTLIVIYGFAPTADQVVDHEKFGNLIPPEVINGK